MIHINRRRFRRRQQNCFHPGELGRSSDHMRSRQIREERYRSLLRGHKSGQVSPLACLHRSIRPAHGVQTEEDPPTGFTAAFFVYIHLSKTTSTSPRMQGARNRDRDGLIRCHSIQRHRVLCGGCHAIGPGILVRGVLQSYRSRVRESLSLSHIHSSMTADIASL